MRLSSILFSLVVLAGSLQAGTISAVPTRLALNANDIVAWGTSAQDGESQTLPYVVSSSLGLMTSSGAPSLTVFQQNGALSGFLANFADGEILLTAIDGGPMEISFATPIRGIGFNIAHIVPGSFTGQIAFYGAGNVLFGSVSQSGTSSFDNDGSAVFIGGTSSLRDVVRVVVSVDSQSGTDGFSINQASLLTTDANPEIPEPSTVTMFSIAAVAAFAAHRRRR